MDAVKSEGASLVSRLRLKALELLTLAVTKAATKRILRKFVTNSNGTLLYFNLCIKIGRSVSFAEANALRFVAKHTSIPVPRVHHAFTHKGRAYVVMERIRGETIAKRWRLLSDTSKMSIYSQLKEMIEELRSIPSPHHGVSNLDGGPIHDDRLPHTSSWGPFGTLTEFHLALRNDITSQSLQAPNDNPPSPTVISDVQKLIAFHDSVLHPPVLTHGDLSSFNILVRDDNVVGIIDWETAGWLPYYWEYTTAWHANPQNQFWQKEVGHFLEPLEEELGMEKIRRRYFGDV